MMESFAGGPFGNWASGLMSSVCTHSCSDKQHYHRHCGCALHSIDKGFKGSPSCSPSCTVKVSGSAPRSGMFRSISVQNFGEKKYNSYSEDEAVSTFDFSPNSSETDSTFSRSSVCHSRTGRECAPSVETLTLVEELASFIHLVKDGDSGSVSQHDEENASDDIGWIADEEVPAASISNSLSAFTPQVHPLIIPNPSATLKPPTPPPTTTSFVAGSTDPQLAGLLPHAGPLVRELSAMFTPSTADHLLSLRASLLEPKLSTEPEVARQAKWFISHRRMRSSGR